MSDILITMSDIVLKILLMFSKSSQNLKAKIRPQRQKTQSAEISPKNGKAKKFLKKRGVLDAFVEIIMV